MSSIRWFNNLKLILAVMPLLFLSLTPTPIVSEELNKIVGREDCKFIFPPEWQDRTVVWDGGCQNGKAHGQGVLRAYKDGLSTLLFLGNLEYGEISLGVIDCDDGYIAGQFSHGELLPDLDRNVVINAFRNAAAAAKTYSKRLERLGNQESASFYLKKADELEHQLD
ncbi:hypothetical protein [Methylobacter sp.]|uniref:hypothetical protein n=1 Tax=Methylobacter sp. TaxID=2051955 RepID=UPI003DA1D7CF